MYWRRGARQRLRSLSPSEGLMEQLAEQLSAADSPVWMDSSTSAQCRAIEAALGGPQALASLSGSRAFERYSGPQIRKIAEDTPEVYQETERVSLVSSFGASLLLGDYAAIDHSDGAGMNLMDLSARDWAPTALQVPCLLPPLLSAVWAPGASSLGMAHLMSSAPLRIYREVATCIDLLLLPWHLFALSFALASPSAPTSLLLAALLLTLFAGHSARIDRAAGPTGAPTQGSWAHPWVPCGALWFQPGVLCRGLVGGQPLQPGRSVWRALASAACAVSRMQQPCGFCMQAASWVAWACSLRCSQRLRACNLGMACGADQPSSPVPLACSCLPAFSCQG